MTKLRGRYVALAVGLLMSPTLALAQQIVGDTELAAIAMEQMNNQMIIGAASLVIIIIAALVFATLRERRRQELYARLVEKGQVVPSALLPTPPSRLRELRRATWLSSLGLSLGLILYIATGDVRVAAWCLIPLFLGIGSFINAALFYPETHSDQ